jgi:S1-C subfamily serine protease
MIQEEHELYNPYQQTLPYPAYPSVGVLDDRSQVPPTQSPSQPPYYPAGPQPTETKPKRPRRGGAILVLALVLTLIFGVGLFAGWEFAGGHTTTTGITSQATTASKATSSSTVATIETQQEAAITTIEPAVVELEVTTAQGEQIGSGVIIDSNGDIVTNNHVVNGAVSIKAVLSNGNTETAQLIGTSSANDLAVVRIAPFSHMTVAQIADSSTLTVGQEVLAIGNPLGITETVTSGIVSAVNRSVTESTGTTISQAIQTDAAINPGNSGGALVNLQGQLVGIPTLAAVNTESNTAANGIGFAIPSNLVKTTVQQILQQGQ